MYANLVSLQFIVVIWGVLVIWTHYATVFIVHACGLVNTGVMFVARPIWEDLLLRRQFVFYDMISSV